MKKIFKIYIFISFSLMRVLIVAFYQYRAQLFCNINETYKKYL